jgi:ABC-2 type transport system permease protein
MSGLYAVFRKEVANFFVSPIAYVLIAIFLLISGFIFRDTLAYMSLISVQAANNPAIAERINPTEAVVQPVLQTMAIILLFVMPLITMRLFSEEKKSGTIELLLTYPITDMAVLGGKFLAALFVLAVMLGMTLMYPVLLLSVGVPELGTTLSGYLGLFLMGMSFLALGTFVSCLTENQIIASAITFAVAILVWIVRATASISGETLGAVLRQMSILEHLEPFIKGVVSLSDLSFFLLFTLFFLFLTLRSVEAYRWRG